ncbi:hypothetical protein [Streptomyces sp. NPDC058394]|uniref:hypothetical protein n=1 Tax=Streptomyces sp. NPDC058394 TaxID=3346477 RepID=UPI003655E3DE
MRVPEFRLVDLEGAYCYECLQSCGEDERLAERVAGFPETAVRLAKRRIHAAGLPAKEDIQVDAGIFQILARDASSTARGMQERSRTELDFGAAVGEL